MVVLLYADNKDCTKTPTRYILTGFHIQWGHMNKQCLAGT